MMAQFSWQRMTVISVYVNMVRSTVQTLRRVVKQVCISRFIRKSELYCEKRFCLFESIAFVIRPFQQLTSRHDNSC